MNFFHKTIFYIAVLITTSLSAIAQDQTEIPDLIKQGTQLNDQGKYAEAIDKYNQALKIDPENARANYELGFSLLASGKGNEGIPYVEKAIQGSNSISLSAACYDLLGSIYDQGHQPEKAIETYKKGIEVNPKYQRLYYNLGITYSRNKQYAEAEASAIEAIKLDPKHASSQRLYALAAFHQNKRVNALLGFCSFILLEPTTQRSAEAYGNIQHILQGGVLKDDKGRNTIILSPKDNQENQASNLTISVTVVSGQNKKLSGMDLLEYEFKSIFSIAGQVAEKKTDQTFFDKFFAGYFYKLAQSDHMVAFTRLVSLSANKEAYAKWMSDNEKQLKDLDNWVNTTERSF
jgi:tetratricopeptide (TPR) repeat protein